MLAGSTPSCFDTLAQLFAPFIARMAFKFLLLPWAIEFAVSNSP
jgi:hypothetical protein